jgi:hypothetical protein
VTSSDFFCQTAVIFIFGIAGCACCTLRWKERRFHTFEALVGSARHLYWAMPLLGFLPVFNVYAGTRPSIQWEMPAWLQYHWAGLSWGVICGVLAYVFGFCSVAAATTGHRWKWPAVYFGAVVLTFIQVYALWSERPNLPPIGGAVVSGDGVILQTTPFTCVPAAGANIAAILGVRTSEKELVELCHTTRYGTFPAQVLYGLEKLGITGRKAPEDGGIEAVKPPAMLFISEDTHAVVYNGMKNGRIEIWNPSLGKVLVPEWRLGQLWDGHALEFQRAAN